MVCARPSCLVQNPSPIHSGTLGSGHATSIDRLQSLEAGPGCKVGHGGRGQQHLWSREEIASQAAFHTTVGHSWAQGLVAARSLLFVELKA